MGPNVKRLVIERAAILMVPPGGGIHTAMLTDAAKLSDVMRQATEWVNQAIAVVKTAPDNHFGDDDEAIAGEILQRIQERRGR